MNTDYDDFNNGNRRKVPMLPLEQPPPYTEITMEDDDDISYLTDPTMTGGSLPPYQPQNPPGYAQYTPSPQPQFTQYPPQPPQFAQYPPQPPPQQQQHIYVNPPQRAYKPPPPPVIHINPQAPLLPTHYNTNLPQNLQLVSRQDDRNLSNINADERALRIGLLVSE